MSTAAINFLMYSRVLDRRNAVYVRMSIYICLYVLCLKRVDISIMVTYMLVVLHFVIEEDRGCKSNASPHMK